MSVYMPTPAHLRRALIAVVGLLSIVAVASTARAATPISAYTTTGTLSYVSAPSLHPPKMTTISSESANKLAPGYFLISNFKNLAMSQEQIGQGGPIMLDRDLRPVWIHPTPTNVYALNFRTQKLNGLPALSWWQGVISNQGVVQSGEDFVVDQHYKTIATLEGADGWVLTPHEFLVSGNNAWVTANKYVSGVDLTSFGGPANGTILDSAVQEYSLRNGKLLYSWEAYEGGHIPLSESKTVGAAPMASSQATAWDAYHINAINLIGNSEFLVSMRNTRAGYLVNIATGAIQWTLGGTNSSFTFGTNAPFEWQHDIELHAGSEVSLFDDACCALIGPGKFAPPFGPSRGLVLKLDSVAHTATIVAQYAHNPTLNTSTQGDTELLGDGDVLVGWGGQPYLTEYSRTGKVLLDASFPGPDISYRAYVEPWVGLPTYGPSGAGRRLGSKTKIYASWNGATQVASWEVLAGPSASHLSKLAVRHKAGFETAIALNHTYREFKIYALDSRGRVLGRTGAFHAVKGRLKSPPPVTGY
jgi:hypothetical protein